MAPSDPPAKDTSPVAATAKTQNAAPRGGGGRVALLFASLALLLSAACAGWLGYEFWQAREAGHTQPWSADIAQLQSRVEARLEDQQQQRAALVERIEQSQLQLRESLQGQQQDSQLALQQQAQSLTQLKQRQQMLEERVQSLVRLNRDDWILAEAEYLLRLAGQRLELGADIGAAETLLKAAQRNLQLVHDAGLDPVREVLARDIEALAEAGRFDIRALYQRLDTLAGQARELTPLGDRAIQPERVASDRAPPPELAFDTLWPLFKYTLASAAEKLQSFIRVSDRDGAYQRTVIAGGQRELFRQNLQLLFDQAQWALFRGEADLYRQILERCEEWIRRYYALESAEQAVLAELVELREQALRPEPVVVDASIDALELYIDARRGSGEAQP